MNQKTKPISVITIDGPSGTGKGTLALALSHALGFHYLDSGVLYRAIAHGLLEAGIAPSDDHHIEKILAHFQIETKPDQAKGVSVSLNGQDVTAAVREEAVGLFASDLAKKPMVRRQLLHFQRSQAKHPGLVTDGRDMGTVVFPKATLKIFLTASAKVRADRRYKQLKGGKRHVSLRQVEDDLNLRDQQDMARLASPLRPAEDAVTIDTTRLSIDRVLSKVLNLWEERQPPSDDNQ